MFVSWGVATTGAWQTIRDLSDEINLTAVWVNITHIYMGGTPVSELNILRESENILQSL